MLKDALEYLVGMGKKETLEVKGKTFIVGGNAIQQVQAPIQEALQTSTLQSIVNYLHDDPDRVLFNKAARIIIHVKGVTEIKVFRETNVDDERSKLLDVSAILPKGIEYDNFYDMESFNIVLQSRVLNTHDRAKLLTLVGNVKEKEVKNVSDDGITQAATIKTGVASVSDVQVPNPVTLAPYRTFTEVNQPASDFVFRMRTGPAAALFEADGGAWKLEAIANIAAWLNGNLQEALGDRFNQITILS